MSAALRESFNPLCCRSSIPIDSGLYKAEYLTSMLSLDIIPFQSSATNEPPLSDVTKDGRPKKDVQCVRKAVAASEDEASLRGIACRKRVLLQMAVSKNL